MTNSQKIIEYCPNYYDIAKERFSKDDNITREILNSYKSVIERTNYEDIDELNKVKSFDESVYAYFNDKKYNEIILSGIYEERKDEDLVEFMINSFKIYKENPANKVTTTKWL